MDNAPNHGVTGPVRLHGVDAGHGCRRYDLDTGSHTGCHDPHHPMGEMQVLIDYERDGNSFIHKSAGLVRTARKLAEGVLYVPSSVWQVTGG